MRSWKEVTLGTRDRIIIYFYLVRISQFDFLLKFYLYELVRAS